MAGPARPPKNRDDLHVVERKKRKGKRKRGGGKKKKKEVEKPQKASSRQNVGAR